MSEENLIKKIKQQRKEAIELADKKYANQFMKKQRQPVVLMLLILLLVFLMAIINYSNNIPRVIYQYETIREQPIINQISLVNRTEVVIKGEKEMICIGPINGTEFTCYREPENV